MSRNTFIIVYHGGRGHRDALTVVDVSGTEHERHDYALASRQDFDNAAAAIAYAKDLARRHNKAFIPPAFGEVQHDYLD